MDISKLPTSELLTELQKRSEILKEQKGIPYSLVLGSIYQDKGVENIEVFKLINTQDDLKFLKTYSLRCRFNSHRDIKLFYFKTSSFENLNNLFIHNNTKLAEFVRRSPNVKYMNP